MKTPRIARSIHAGEPAFVVLALVVRVGVGVSGERLAVVRFIDLVVVVVDEDEVTCCGVFACEEDDDMDGDVSERI